MGHYLWYSVRLWERSAASPRPPGDVTLAGAVDAYLATLLGDRAVFSGGEVRLNDAVFSAGT
jgi:hypothetical protein